MIVRHVTIQRWIIGMAFISLLTPAHGAPAIEINGTSPGKKFDGIGVVNGGGATSVLLKDYPEPQRSQILDLVCEPVSARSVSALIVEIPGDGNSTQGSMPSHMHTRDDLNYRAATRGGFSAKQSDAIPVCLWTRPHGVPLVG